MKLQTSQHMLMAAGAAREILEPPACRRIAAYVMRQVAPDGGFRGRGPGSDLYYSVFGSGCLLALDAELDIPRFLAYVQRFGDGRGLDFVHLCCLARCLSLVPDMSTLQDDAMILDRIRTYRTPDGGFHQQAATHTAGSAYAAFLALMAHEDLDEPLREPDLLLDSLQGCRADDGSYGNCPGMTAGTTTATAAALFVQHRLSADTDAQAVAWLQARFHERGGATASPATPLPDLLSTATAIFTLKALDVDLSDIAAETITMVELLWNEDGGFGMAPMHATSDCEYTFYALMALGMLLEGV